MIKTSKQALATHLGMDFADMEHYRYRGRVQTIPVYAVGNEYYCSSKTKPAKEIGSNITDELKWGEVKDDFVNRDGWKIFQAKSE